MKSFKSKFYSYNDIDSNWKFVNKAEKLGFKDPHRFKFIGYEIDFLVEMFENGSNKVLKINGVDVSDKDINI